MMSPPWALMLYLTVISSAIGYKLPLSDQSFLTDPHNIGESSSPPLVWEWESQDKSDKTLVSLIRKVRDVLDKKKTESQKDAKYPTKASKSPLDTFPDITPRIKLPSKSSYTTHQIMAQRINDLTTPLSEVDPTSTEEQTSEAETTQTYKSPQKIATQMKFTSTQEQLSTPSPTNSKDLHVHTKSTAMETTTLIQIHSTTEKLLSRIPVSTSDKVVDETSTVPTKIPTETPSKPSSAEPTTRDETTGWIQDFKSSSTSLGIVTTSAPVTHISTTSEDKILNQYIMKQCMLTILILAVVCTIFIITTIALAAKLSTLRQKQKLRHPATYTEMRCISSLLPESEQQNKGKPKRLKTFAGVEESDGDNTTLNSFLPDH